MTQLPDVSTSIKVIDDDSGKRVLDGGEIFAGFATVRYVVVNDSNKTAGPLTVVGSLFRDGVRLQPNGKAKVFPAQQITLQPNQVWKFEFPVNERQSTSTYEARILADVGNSIAEEDETNNSVRTTFQMVIPPR